MTRSLSKTLGISLLATGFQVIGIFFVTAPESIRSIDGAETVRTCSLALFGVLLVTFPLVGLYELFLKQPANVAAETSE